MVGMSEVKKENHALRAVTAILMFFIAGAHYYSRAKIGDELVNDFIFDVGRFAIPIIVMTSGYFCYSSDGHVESRMGRKMKHILILIIIYKLFYLLVSLTMAAFGKVDMEYVIQEFLIVSPPIEFDRYGGTIELETTQPIWFIYALLALYVLWWAFWKLKIDYKWTLLIAIPVLIICLLAGEFFPLLGIEYIGDVDVWQLSGVMYPFVTLPFFVMGYFMHKHKDWIDGRISNGMVWGLIAFGTVLTFVEAYFVGSTQVIYCSSVILAFSLFLGTFRVPEDRYRIGPLIYIGRYLTIWMYVLFGFACLVMRAIMSNFTDSYFLSEIAGPFLAVILDIILALGVHLLLQYIGKRKTAGEAPAAV